MKLAVKCTFALRVDVEHLTVFEADGTGFHRAHQLGVRVDGYDVEHLGDKSHQRVTEKFACTDVEYVFKKPVWVIRAKYERVEKALVVGTNKKWSYIRCLFFVDFYHVF